MSLVSLRSTIMALASLSLLLLAACSGKSSGEPRFDPKRADELAHAMMPDAGAFPGTGWKVVAEDEFDDEDEDESETPEACKELEREFGSTEDFVDEDPRGRAQTEYELKSDEDDPFAIPASIEVEAEIHDNADGLKEGLAELKDMLDHPQFEDCMDAFLLKEMEADPVDESVEIEFKVVKSDVATPRDGASMAFDASIEAGDLISLDMHIAIFFWRVGNAGITVTVAGAKDDMTDEFIRTALDRVDGAAVVASKK